MFDTQLFRVLPNILWTGIANVKFGRPIQGGQPKHMAVIIFFQKESVALSRDSQHFSVPPNISGTGKAMNVEVVNKTAKIKCKKTYQFTAYSIV